MTGETLIYGANGYMGKEIAKLAVREGLKPILAGRDKNAVKEVANEFGTPYRIFDLVDPSTIARALEDVDLVLNCAGPYIFTSSPMVDACIKSGAHYLDITGEIPVYQAIAMQDEAAKAAEVMLLPGIGFDVAPTDCLALHLKNRLPEATHLVLAFHIDGPAGLPPGTQNTAIEHLQYGELERVGGELFPTKGKPRFRDIDFGKGPVRTLDFPWGDIYTAWFSTGIPNIKDYVRFPNPVQKQLVLMKRFKPLFSSAFVRRVAKKAIKPGPSYEECAATSTHVWGEVRDAEGNRASSVLHGPEAGVTWTSITAIAGVKKVLSGIFKPGFQTPAMAFGADFVLECEEVSRKDLEPGQN